MPAAGAALSAVKTLREEGGGGEAPAGAAEGAAVTPGCDGAELNEALERLCAASPEPRAAGTALAEAPGEEGGNVLQPAAWVNGVRAELPLPKERASRAREQVAACADLAAAGLPAPPRPSLPAGVERMPLRLRLAELQRFISAFQYNYTDTNYFNVRKDRPLTRILDTARQITRDALPIKCVEATFLGLLLTTGITELDRISVGFKTKMGTSVHRHIVLVVHHRQSGKYGALGISRRSNLMYKDLVFGSMGELLSDYKASYEGWWHELLKVRVGLPVEHDAYSTAPVCWRYCCLGVQGKDWEKLCEKFDEHCAKAHRLYDKWQVLGPKAKQQSALSELQKEKPWRVAPGAKSGKGKAAKAKAADKAAAGKKAAAKPPDDGGAAEERAQPDADALPSSSSDNGTGEASTSSPSPRTPLGKDPAGDDCCTRCGAPPSEPNPTCGRCCCCGGGGEPAPAQEHEDTDGDGSGSGSSEDEPEGDEAPPAAGY